MKPSIVVIGSTNTDMVIKADHLPTPGETILGGNFFMNPGGKGANQAVAAKRLGGSVAFISKTGNDVFGRQSVQLFEEEGINIDYMISDPLHPSGVALITIDKNGENCIVVAPGANSALTEKEIEGAYQLLLGSSIILMQLEIPLQIVAHIASLAAGSNSKLIVNPAPACSLPLSLLQNIDILTPNRKEAEMISGIPISNIEEAGSAATAIREMGVGIVIITLGAEGALISSKDTNKLIKAPSVKAVDTTAAGDVFNGALAVALSEGKSLEDAVAFSCKAAAISVTRLGAQAAAPYRQEVEPAGVNTI